MCLAPVQGKKPLPPQPGRAVLFSVSCQGCGGSTRRCLGTGPRKPSRTQEQWTVSDTISIMGQEQGTHRRELGGGWRLGVSEEGPPGGELGEEGALA